MRSQKSLTSKVGGGSQSQKNLNQSGVTGMTGMSIMKDVLAQ